MRVWLRRLGVVSALVLSASVAQAEPDAFGIGDGHSGPRTFATGDNEVNSYAALTTDTAAGATVITATQPLGPAFGANDLVMIWRATGVDASEAPSGDQSKRLNLASALATTSVPGTLSAGLVGRYELARVASIDSASGGIQLTFTKPLVNAFVKNVTQVIRIPEYTTVSIAAGATVRAKPWQELNGNPAAPNPNNPWVGGMVIFFATGAVTNAGTIHANERGFHGGTPTARLLSLNLTCNSATLDGDPTATNDSYSPKGEGVVQSKFSAQSGGKGNIAMAGGGGNCLESGGGGGANSGNGGTGSAALLGFTNSGGLGGVGIDYDLLSRLTMGGGGGSGRENTGLSSQIGLGGFGGGVVYVRGGSLVGTGIIQSNGGNGEDSGLVGLPPTVLSEGSGGGGAGGTVVIRLTGALDCSQLGSNGGNGGNAQALGLGIFGAGGGGGGGRILFQASAKTGTCNVQVNPGSAGNSTSNGAENGDPGTTVPNLPPLCVPASPGAPGSCVDPTPVCDPLSGACTACSGPFGGGPPDPCQVAVDPVCLPTGACVPCKGDFNSGVAEACQLAGAPTCFPTGAADVAGSCGKCTVDADCSNGPHPGQRCDVASGACGTPCTKDEDCRTTEWCAPISAATTNGVCVPKVPNGQPEPAGPPINGICSPENGQRTCLSAVCEESDDLCGKRNSSPCPGGATQCRSNICFDADRLCGLPNGQPCGGDGQCRSDLCQNGVCTGKPCGTDPDCPLGQVCDPNSKTCVDGCRPGVSGPADGGAVNGVCEPPGVCVGDGGAIGTCNPGDGGLADGGSDAGTPNPADTAGIIEGGGCSCDLTMTSAASPLSILGAISSLLLLVRRRNRRNGGKA